MAPLLTQASPPRPARSPGPSNEFFKRVKKNAARGRNEGKNDESAQGDQVGGGGAPEPISGVRRPVHVLTSQLGG